jgi:hypothetical protein
MIIWAVLVVAIGVVCRYKSKQSPMTKEEQEFELQVVNQRSSSFLMNTTKHEPYNGVEG